MKLKLNIKYILVIFVVFVVVVGIGLSIFKYSNSIYVDSKKWDYNYSSSNVYISSDLLKSINENNVLFYMLSYDTAPIDFKVFNYESDTQISKTDLTYDLTCTVPSGYICYIDGIQGGSQNNTIQKDYTCSIANLSADECEENSNANITYRKNSKTHNIMVKSASGAVSTGSCIVDVSLTLKRPYYTNLSSKLNITFNPDEQGIKAKLIKSYENKCIYSVTNYSESGTFNFEMNNVNDLFADGYGTSLVKTMNRYETINDFIVYKNGESHLCDNLFNISRVN